MLKVGVFGVGHLVKFHLNNWKEMEDVELVGFYDPNIETSKAVAEKYNLKHFESADALLNKIEVTKLDKILQLLQEKKDQ